MHLLNRVQFPFNFVPNGLLGTAANQAQVVVPGQNATYTFTVPTEVLSASCPLNLQFSRGRLPTAAIAVAMQPDRCRCLRSRCAADPLLRRRCRRVCPLCHPTASRPRAAGAFCAQCPLPWSDVGDRQAVQSVAVVLRNTPSPAVLTQAGPGALEGVSSKLFLYQSLLDQAGDDNSGLIGPIVITARGKALPDGRPNDVDTEFVTVFKVRHGTPRCALIKRKGLCSRPVVKQRAMQGAARQHFLGTSPSPPLSICANRHHPLAFAAYTVTPPNGLTVPSLIPLHGPCADLR